MKKQTIRQDVKANIALLLERNIEKDTLWSSISELPFSSADSSYAELFSSPGVMKSATVMLIARIPPKTAKLAK